MLEDQQNSLIPFGGAGLFYRLIPRLELGAQYVMHGALYDDTEIDALKKPGGQLVVEYDLLIEKLAGSGC